MEIQKSAAEYGTEIRAYYPSIPSASTRAATDDLIEYADKKEKKGVATGQLKPKPDGNEYEIVTSKFTETILTELGTVDPQLRQLVEDLLAYTAQIVNISR